MTGTTKLRQLNTTKSLTPAELENYNWNLWAVEQALLSVGAVVPGSTLPSVPSTVHDSHHLLTDLNTYDDHSQYLYLAGRTSIGQIITSKLSISGFTGTSGKLIAITDTNVTNPGGNAQGLVNIVSGVAYTVQPTLLLQNAGTTGTVLSLIANTPLYTTLFALRIMDYDFSTYSFIDSRGSAGFRHGASLGGNRAVVISGLTNSEVPLTLRVNTAGGTTPDVLQVRDTTDTTTLVKIDTAGNITAPSFIGTWAGSILESQITDGAILARVAAAETIAGQWLFASQATGNIPLTIQGFAGQTTNLTNWKNNVGTILASVKLNGNILAAAFEGDGSLLTGLLVGQLADFASGNFSVTGLWTFNDDPVFTTGGVVITVAAGGTTQTGGFRLLGNDYVEIQGNGAQAAPIIVQLPVSSGTLIGNSETVVVTNKILSTGTKIRTQTATTFQDPTSTTKQMQLGLSGITAGATRGLTVQDDSATIAGIVAVGGVTNDLIGKVASVAAYIAYTTVHAGQYLVTAYAVFTVATVPGNLTFKCSWTDAQGAKVSVPFANQESSTTGLVGVGYAAAGDSFSATKVIQCTAATAIKPETVLTGTGTYNVYFRVTALT